MYNLSEALIQKCSYIWANRSSLAVRFPELKNKNLLSEEEIHLLSNYFNWTDRANCAEIIGAIALNLPQKEIRCEITNQPVHFSIPFYRLYSEKEVIHKSI